MLTALKRNPIANLFPAIKRPSFKRSPVIDKLRKDFLVLVPGLLRLTI